MKKIVFLFPGQGSQFPGMGKDLYDGFETIKRVFEEADEALGFDLKKMCFEGSADNLALTENTQPALLTICYSAFKVLIEETGAVPDFLAGHSLGEITALTCSGAIPFGEAVKIVKLRGKFMQEAVAAGDGSMAAINGTTAGAVKDACFTAGKNAQDARIACYNSLEQFVISGKKDSIALACDRLERMLGAKCSILKVSAPFHTPFMEPAAIRFLGALEKCKFNGIKWPVISNVSALPYENSREIVQNLTMQITMPVQWQATMDYLSNNGVGIAVEVGPGKVLKNLLRGNNTSMKAYSSGNTGDIDALRRIFPSEKEIKRSGKSGIDIIDKCLAEAVCARNKNWDEEQYDKGVIEPCGKIKQFQKSRAAGNGMAAAELNREAIQLLKLVLETKKVDPEERQRIITELSADTASVSG